MPVCVAKIAVSAATYWLDKPYDYLVPEELRDRALPGARVYVPFSRGNRRCEGVILALADHSDFKKLKPVAEVLDDSPVLSNEQIKLALFMRERFFCTVYEAIKAMLPAGLWFDNEGRRRVSDKTIEMARLAVAPEEASAAAEARRGRAPQQANLLELLCSFECLPSRELTRFTSAARQSLTALERQGLVVLYKREAFRRPELHYTDSLPVPLLNEEQERAFQGLNALAGSGRGQAALLFGVTGSGKTSVYIHLIMEQLKRGKSAVMLVPEIALTPQMIETFSSHFGDNVAVLHSSLSTGERYDEWKRIKQGKARLTIGTRSAVFAPAQDLGLVIIDEEQEETYKSENSPRYNAGDIAKYRCLQSGALLLLGSATPDVVSMYKAKTGQYAYFELKSRYNDMMLPDVEIVDMKRELRRGNGGNISSRLRDELAANIERGEQSILFINRRGANKLISCGECGFTYKCPRCSVSLTYHSDNRRLMCHYCGFSRWLDNSCPECGGTLNFIGAGTQMIASELAEIFPDIEIMRVDADSVAPAGSHEELFDRFKRERVPIMVGTQMVTKGLNFENVTLVGVLSADQSLCAGDYRASERAFSLMTQVVGRSGRGRKPGRAIIQTYTPENEVIKQAANQDYESFYQSEIQLRKMQNSPPFSELIAITVSGMMEERVVAACRRIKLWLDDSAAKMPETAVLGPCPMPVVKVNNRYRYRVTVCGKVNSGLRALVSRILTHCGTDKFFSGVSVFADNAPLD